MTGRCGNDPRAQLTDGDRQAVEEFRAHLAARRAEPSRETASLVVPRADRDPVTVEATVVAPGLYVHPTAPVEDGSPSDQWRITHHSGRLIAHFPSEGQALSAGVAIAPFADWTLSDEELHTAGQNDEIDVFALEEVIDDHGGLLVRRRVILPTDLVHVVDPAPAGGSR